MSRPTSHRVRQVPAPAGFTLIEILIVITILGVLMAVLLPNVLGASRQGQVTETKARMLMLQTAIDAFEKRDSHPWYPPDNFKAVDGEFKVLAKEDSTNPGIESLVIFLHQRREAGITVFDDKREWLENTDHDLNSAPIPMLGTSEKLEVVDAWGMPYAYFTSYTKGYERDQMIQPREGEPQKARAMRDAGGKFLNEGRYQLISAGPDLLFGTEDDITYPAGK